MSFKIGLIGGAGHIGFPLALAFASKKINVLINDINKENIDKIEKGFSPFKEENVNSFIKRYKKYYKCENNIKNLTNCKFLIFCIGNALDKNGKVNQGSFLKNISSCLKHFSNKNIIIIRSSVMPGTMEYLKKKFPYLKFAYCPERILQGKSLVEIFKLPQIISTFDFKTYTEVRKLFNKISNKIIKTNVSEAELIKLFTNAYRYILFAISNSFLNISLKNNINFNKILNLMKIQYPRNHNLPYSGFAAGPCLEKDILQLSKVFGNKFKLGLEAYNVNHHLPNKIIEHLKKKWNLKNKSIGILGTTFKANIDDERNSLALDLKNKLTKLCKHVYLSDYHVNKKNYVTEKFLITKSDIIIIGTPHDKYKKIKINKKKLINIWW